MGGAGLPKRRGGAVYHAHVARCGGRQGRRQQRVGLQFLSGARAGPPMGRRAAPRGAGGAGPHGQRRGREADLAVRQGDAGNVRRVRRHLPAALLGRAVVELEADELRSWRDGLTKSLAAATVNRVITVLGAALNHLADLDHRVAANRQSWRSGLKAIAGAARANNVILPNAVVAKLVETAAEFGDDFHRLVWVEAETG